jgi:hypothetical protein
VAAVATLLAAGAAVPASAGRPATDTSAVRLFSDSSVVGQSTLQRLPSSLQMTLETTGLPAGHVVTVWWVIFNNPAACSHGEPANPATGFAGTRFGAGDLFVPAVQASAVHAAGHVIGANGVGNYASYLSVGSTTDQILFGPGLSNPMGADVHFVVHDHDALSVLQGVSTIGKEINSIGALPGDDLQFSAHEA